MRPPSPVWRFALWVLLLVGPCFALWYALAPWYDRPAAWLARAAIGFFGTDVVQSLAFDDRVVAFMTTLEARGSAGERGLLTVEVNPLLYTFGAPLLAVLLLASPRGWRKLPLGLVLLLPFQAWGIAFDFLAQLVRSGPAVASQAALTGWKLEAAALGYQLGSLILPAASPVVLWAMLQREYVARMTAAQPSRNKASVSS